MKVKVCVGASCTMMGSSAIVDAIESLSELADKGYVKWDSSELEVEMVNCLEYCKGEEEVSPVVIIDDQVITKAEPHEVTEKILAKLIL